MVRISFDDGQLAISPSGKQFFDAVESCKYLGARFDKSTKQWLLSPSKYAEAIAELKQYKLDISPADEKAIEQHFQNMCELRVIETRKEMRKPIYELLNANPLKEFQASDIVFSLNRNRAMLGWKTGLGKSYALAALLANLRHYGEVKRAIILTSSIGVLNLNSELRKFIKDYDESKTLVIDKISSLKDRLIFDKDYDIVIMGYDTFRSIGDAYDKKLNARKGKVKYRKSPLPLKEWFGNYKGCLFLDECHLLGSHSSLRSKFMEMNLHFFEYRYLMSATWADKEEKMYVSLKVLDKQLVNGEDYIGWASQFCEIGNRWSKYGLNKETWNYVKWAELQDTLYHHYARKRGKELLGLPPAYDVPTISLNMSAKQREIYEAFTYEVIGNVKTANALNNGGLVANFVNNFAYLQLAVDNPSCLITTPGFSKFNAKLQAAIKAFNFEKDFAKLDALDGILDEECNENGNKVIIFYNHPLTLEALKIHLKKGFDVLSAEVPKNERFDVINAFKKSPNKILIASINIANTSFTLTECKAAIYFERTFAYLDYEQSRGRIHRHGQDEETRYYTLCYNWSIDNLALRALETKGRCLENLVKRNSLSSDDWKLVMNANLDVVEKLEIGG